MRERSQEQIDKAKLTRARSIIDNLLDNAYKFRSAKHPDYQNTEINDEGLIAKDLSYGWNTHADRALAIALMAKTLVLSSGSYFNEDNLKSLELASKSIEDIADGKRAIPMQSVLMLYAQTYNALKTNLNIKNKDYHLAKVETWKSIISADLLAVNDNLLVKKNQYALDFFHKPDSKDTSYYHYNIIFNFHNGTDGNLHEPQAYISFNNVTDVTSKESFSRYCENGIKQRKSRVLGYVPEDRVQEISGLNKQAHRETVALFNEFMNDIKTRNPEIIEYLLSPMEKGRVDQVIVASKNKQYEYAPIVHAIVPYIKQRALVNTKSK